MNDLVLYYSPGCPYCLNVLRFMENRGIEIELRNTMDYENQDTLISVGKKNQVPCLFIEGEPLYESTDIMAYLAKRFDCR